MAKATCPEGHPTTETDYCDVCGAPIESSAVASGDDSAEAEDKAAEVGLRCPNCQVMNAPDALFCEACGYDYTTGTLPRAAQPSVLELDMEVARADQHQPQNDPEAGSDQDARAGSDDADEARPARRGATAVGNPLDLDTPAPTPTTGADEDAAGAASSDAGSPSADSPNVAAAADPETPRSPQAQESDNLDQTPPPADSAAASANAGRNDRVIASAEPVDFEWVAELWIDPDWYRLQEAPDPMPSPGLPEMYPLKSDRVLIGRPSRSRNITPDIDCEPDSGTSRRQAELTTDGRNWFIEDLDSANGTFVGQAAGSLPETPIPAHKKYQLDADDRIYVGAWTRLVLRKATEDEKEAFAV